MPSHTAGQQQWAMTLSQQHNQRHESDGPESAYAYVPVLSSGGVR